jgi:hypothetical protein
VGADVGVAWPETTPPTSMYLVECVMAHNGSHGSHGSHGSWREYQRARPLARTSGVSAMPVPTVAGEWWLTMQQYMDVSGAQHSPKPKQNAHERRDVTQANTGSKTARCREANVYEHATMHVTLPSNGWRCTHESSILSWIGSVLSSSVQQSARPDVHSVAWHLVLRGCCVSACASPHITPTRPKMRQQGRQGQLDPRVFSRVDKASSKKKKKQEKRQGVEKVRVSW